MVLNVFIAVLNYIGKNNDGNEKVTILWNLILRFSARFSSQENCQGTPIQLNHLRSNRTGKKTKLQYLQETVPESTLGRISPP